MTRRCKPGQRARVISGTANRGKIVLVVRPYRFGEKISDAEWPEALYPWVVTSLGAPLRWHRVGDLSATGTDMTIVLCDTDLEPLRDDDDGLTRSTNEDKPVKKSRPKTKALVTETSGA